MNGIFENKELKIIGVETNNMQSYEPMFHSHGEILYVSKGSLGVNIDGNKRELRAGDMCVVFPYAIHSYESLEKGSIIYVLFSTESIGEFADVLLSKRMENPFPENAQALLPLLKKAVKYAKTGTTLHIKTAGAYLKALLGEIIMSAELKNIKASDIDTVRAVLGYCAEHFCDDITVRDVAYNTYISERYVTKIFAEKVGLSFREYINTLRMSKAANLMESTSMRITDIMYECGFKNQSTFNKVFLENFECTPRKYRERKSILV